MHLIPGDLLLSDFEDLLGDTWNAAKGGSEPALRAQSAIYRAILQAAEKVSAEAILIDLGPNLGSLNRAVLGGSDYVIVPVAPDLFSIRGAENLGTNSPNGAKNGTSATTHGPTRASRSPRDAPAFSDTSCSSTTSGTTPPA